jgi:hypothetical protein
MINHREFKITVAPLEECGTIILLKKGGNIIFNLHLVHNWEC